MAKTTSDGKFGTISGVFIPNVLQMIGVILFMRLGYVLGHTGIVQMSVIISLSALLLFITGLSLGSIVSNMKMSGGGAYYLISRALGIEFGSAIGILNCTSQLCSIALCVTGFSLSLYEFYPMIPLALLKGVTLSVLVLISYFSTNFAMKTQLFIFIALATSIAAIFLGTGEVPTTLVPNGEVASLSFWAAFAMFFPAMTGIESGMSMSGDLRNPARSLPIGTFSSVAVACAIYMSIAWFLSSKVSPELLRSYPFIMYYASKVGFLIMIGIWAATLSSALGAILGGPRVMQAVAKDGVLPKFLAKGSGPTNQPRVATLTVYVLAMALTLGTNIDQIIPMLTMSCLLSYCLINFISFFEAFMQNPSYRPTLRTHWLVSLTGAVCCLVAMFMINPGAAFIVIALVALFCTITSKRKIKGNWDDLKHSIFSFFVHKGTIKLSNLEASAKSWRPHILTLFDSPAVQANMAFFAHALNQGKGLLTFGANIPSNENFAKLYESLKSDLDGHKIPSHLHLNVCANPFLGSDQIVRNYGFGLLKPNTIILSPPKMVVEPISTQGLFDTLETVDQPIANGEGQIALLEEIASTKVQSSLLQTTQLILATHSQNKNVILFKDDPLKDYLFRDTTRKDKQINLWWRGKYPGNFELCLALAYLLQQSPLWPKAKICIKLMSKDQATSDKLAAQFNTHRSELRIQNLEFHPLVDPDERFFSSFEANSKGADLTFLGLKKPEADTNEENYSDYFGSLLESTKGVNNIAYVLCGEKIKFRNIFRD